MFKKIGYIINWIGNHFKGLLFLLIVWVIFVPSSQVPLKNPNLQEIKLFGPILDAENIVKQIEEAIQDDNIRGVLLNVNSPGGAVPPSIEISYAIRNLQKRKPVIAYASGIMASGSYYSSIYAGKIIANPGAIIGSIGVIMESINIKTLMDTIGIKPQVVKQGVYKEAGTFTRKWTSQERAELEQLTKDTYALFISDVAKARRLDISHSDNYANAHIFLAARAKEIGLIDQVGIISQAKEALMKKANITKPIWKKKDKLESFIEEIIPETIIQLQSYLYGLKAML
ncbi:MAG: signal peptide peptidase SppA [Sulfurovum sp.]|nr:signal peptide peptidase SppA [Sulfurovum sp.]MCB4749819.1 signal peptide peptidase SppA [Sulfurovum sp.]MCB4751048.1 signal peptide peptidase SppA [Sulfurovum sp.]MCB4752049.1 signal peptide peptidase SppA [Sulfurovum sp.]MCB4752900.1 signal peptide peptidase SppA [Sulfurovum sp.]